jgi:hypothetical protein
MPIVCSTKTFLLAQLLLGEKTDGDVAVRFGREPGSPPLSTSFIMGSRVGRTTNSTRLIRHRCSCRLGDMPARNAFAARQPGSRWQGPVGSAQQILDTIARLYFSVFLENTLALRADCVWQRRKLDLVSKSLIAWRSCATAHVWASHVRER